MTTLLEHARASADMEPHLATLAALAAEANRAVEFGVRTGVSTWALLDGLRPDGRLWSVDIDPACAVPDRVRDDQRWTFVVGDSLAAETRRQLPDACELVLIDSSHEYHQTRAELDYAARLGAGLVALHDWNLPDVRDAVTGFLERQRRYQIERIEPSEWGLIVLRRP